MKAIATAMLALIGALTLTVSTASAAVVCNDEGDCWHVRGSAEYKPDLKLRVHPDSWKWGQSDHYRWREHEGHGYWRNGAWVEIK